MQCTRTYKRYMKNYIFFSRQQGNLTCVLTRTFTYFFFLVRARGLFVYMPMLIQTFLNRVERFGKTMYSYERVRKNLLLLQPVSLYHLCFYSSIFTSKIRQRNKFSASFFPSFIFDCFPTRASGSRYKCRYRLLYILFS